MYIHIKIKRFLFFLLLLAIFTKTTLAQESDITSKKTALGVSPAIMEIILDEATPSSKTIQIFNLTNFALPIKTMVESFTPNEKLELSKKDLKVFDSSSWIGIGEENRDFILQPKENRAINVTITQPKGASPGGHYASIIFQPLIPQEMVNEESVFVFARVATLVFMQVKGDIDEDLTIKEMKVSSFYQYPPEKVKVVLKNSGNTHLRPRGVVEIYDEINNKTVAKISITPSLILPNTEKAYSIDMNKIKNLKPGRYSIKPKIVFGTKNTVVTLDKKYFILFPYIFVVSILGIICIVVFIGAKIRKRLNKALNIIIKG